MALEFLHRGAANPKRVIVFPGAWNPPTIAHLDIARAAREHADEIVWTVSRVFPHKEFEGASLAARCRMIEALARDERGFSAAIADRGLYAEIAAEAAAFFGPEIDIRFVLGRDAAERIAGWDYGRPGVFEDFISRHGLLVAARNGEYIPAAAHGEFIRILPMKSTWDEVSSTEIRRRILRREAWRDLVPASIEAIVREVYSQGLDEDTQWNSTKDNRQSII